MEKIKKEKGPKFNVVANEFLNYGIRLGRIEYILEKIQKSIENLEKEIKQKH